MLRPTIAKGHDDDCEITFLTYGNKLLCVRNDITARTDTIRLAVLHKLTRLHFVSCVSTSNAIVKESAPLIIQTLHYPPILIFYASPHTRRNITMMIVVQTFPTAWQQCCYLSETTVRQGRTSQDRHKGTSR